MEAREALPLLEEFDAARNQSLDAKQHHKIQHGIKAERVSELAELLGVEMANRVAPANRYLATKAFGDVAAHWFHIDDTDCARAISNLRMLLKAELALDDIVRTRPLSVDEAAKYFSGESKSNASQFLSRLYRDGVLTPPIGTGRNRRWVVDEFPAAARDNIT